MKGTGLVKDAVVAGVAGYGATKVMSKATTLLYERQSEEAKKKEQQVSYGVAYTVAATKAAKLVGVELSEQAASKAGTLLHYGLGLGWAPLYLLLRKRGVSPFGAGVAAGLSMSLIVDEVANPLLGLTPPPQAYPVATHLRGLAGHLVYGLSLAAMAEATWKLLGRK
ncbi:MAG TPA: DUF1440 domain-containing protein [Cryptosporangiaceae bacterium]|nr:DUF1440 domain-containing protein [Cryptosporangiaceae bacterium]